MYVMLDALADGGVYAGIPKEIGLRLIAHTMIVSSPSLYTLTDSQSIARNVLLHVK